MNFVAQIDLSEIAPEPLTGQRPSGLPEAGMMVVFVSFKAELSHLVTVFPSHAQLQERSEPEDLEPTFHDARSAVFPKWWVRLTPYLDGEDALPPGRLDEQEPHEWITNWGLALAELDAASYAIRLHRSARNRHLNYMRSLKQSNRADERRSPKNIEKTRFFRKASNLQPPLLQEIAAFREIAQSQDAMAPVDAGALARLMSARSEFVASLPMRSRELAPLDQDLQEDIFLSLAKGKSVEDKLSTLSPCFHDFAARHISAWRGHRLFGRKLPETTANHDFSGLRCVLDIKADFLLGTESEHEDGFSIWAPGEAVSSGDWPDTKLFHHTNV